jgi:hypothetical protein
LVSLNSELSMPASYISPFGSRSGSAWRTQNSMDKEKQNGKSAKKVSCGSHVKEFNSETSLHGPKYITEDDNHPIER